MQFRKILYCIIWQKTFVLDAIKLQQKNKINATKNTIFCNFYYLSWNWVELFDKMSRPHKNYNFEDPIKPRGTLSYYGLNLCLTFIQNIHAMIL